MGALAAVSRKSVTRPIRILHVVYGLGRGGLQTGLENLVSGLDSSRFEHTVCALRPPIDHPMCQGLAGMARLMCLKTTESRSRFQVRALLQAIRTTQPDIVHSRNWGCIEAVPAARWHGSCAVIHSEHGIDSDLIDGEPWRRSWFRRLAFEMADQVLSVSHQLRELHARRTGFPAERITVVHNGVNATRFSPDAAIRARVRRDLGMSESDFCIGSVGHLSPVKDHLTELRAIAQFATTVSNWRFIVIGEGPERERLQAFVDAHPDWKARVSMPGLSRAVPDLLKATDVFVLSSITEGICNSLLEAMATGLPVIATRTGGNPEVVMHGTSGLLFPVGDDRALCAALLALHAQPELRQKLAHAAVRRIESDFSVGSMVRNYEHIYTSLAGVRAAAS